MPDKPEHTDNPVPHISPFDAIRQEGAAGNEYWSARELGPILSYSTWQKFSAVVDRAVVACEGSGYAASDHFNPTVKSIVSGKGGKHDIPDYHLSRYACYLVVQNGDPSKPVIAAGQTYFAEQTRLQELAESDRIARRKHRGFSPSCEAGLRRH